MLREVATGLWIWRVRHPRWQPGCGWEPVVTAVCVESRGEVIVLDPIAPGSGPAADAVWQRLDARPPTVLAVLKPDHVRDIDLFARRYKVQGFGPRLFWRDDIPETVLEPIEAGLVLPGGLVALYDGRGRGETPLWLPEQKVIVFADALTAPEPEGELQVWATPWHHERVVPALRTLLELPFEQIIISHGEPVHSRADYERALLRSPWSG